MSAPFTPAGSWTALVTTFDKHGKFDGAAFKRLCEFQIAQGTSGLVPAGTTGESPTLSWEEHNEVIEVAVKTAQSKVGVLAGTGSNCTDEAVAATRHAREAGASAALLVDCYYNGPSSLELRTEYYEAILSWVPEIPVVPYVIPGRSGTALSAEDLALLHLKNPRRVPAVKQATGDLDRMRRERSLAGAGLAILSGDDDLTLAMMQDEGIRCSGVISVMTNLVPGPIAQMVAAQQAGDAAKAGEIGKKLAPLFRLVGCRVTSTRTLPDGRTAPVEDKFRNPTPVKTMMAGLGMNVGPLRRPLGKMTAPAVQICREALKEVHASAPEFLKPVGEFFGVSIEQRLADDGIWAELTR
ncbi:MAG: 4-hydroxy-tetrahydrodipicolinate synthase [Planctomycetota bacterium]|nr:4-hydroxy-tetrahydrodipicolinate synthase [Planctomycetota bacterium]